MTQNQYIEIHRRFHKLSESELRNSDNFDLFGSYGLTTTKNWSSLLTEPRVVILGEGKSGKTSEFQEQVRQLRADGKAAFFIPLESLASEKLTNIISPKDERLLEEWLSENGKPAWFFLDAVDELKLRQGSFNSALRKLERIVRSRLRDVNVIISCRPSDWNLYVDVASIQDFLPTPPLEQIEEIKITKTELFLEGIKRKPQNSKSAVGKEPRASKSEISKPQVYALLPLSMQDIVEYAKVRNSDLATQFVAEIGAQESWQLYQAPEYINDALSSLAQHGRLGTLEQQIEDGVDAKLCERPDRVGKGTISSTRVREGAERLALALSLMKLRTLRVPSDSSDANSSELLDAKTVLPDWTIEEQRELLSRGLFDPAGVNRIRFHHRSVQEFLAAKRLDWLIEKGLPVGDAKSLLFSERYGEFIAIPSMLPIAAWLSLWQPNIRSKLLRCEPEALFRDGIPSSLPIETKHQLLQQFVDAYSGNTWVNTNISLSDLKRLADDRLSSVVKELWDQAYGGFNTRELFLELIWQAKLKECSKHVFSATNDADIPDHHRSLAFKAALVTGTSSDKRNLCVALSNGKLPDRVVRDVAEEIFPDFLSEEEFSRLVWNTKEPGDTVHGFGWTMLKLVEKLEDKPEQLIFLRDLFTKIVWNGRSLESKYYECQSTFSHLSPAIIAACEIQAKTQPPIYDNQWVWSCIIAMRFKDDTVLAGDTYKSVEDLIWSSPKLREKTYWNEMEFCDRLDDDPKDRRLYSRNWNGYICGFVLDDKKWLLRTLETSRISQQKAIATDALMSIWKSEQDDALLGSIKLLTDDDDVLSEKVIEWTTPQKIDEKYEAHESRIKKRKVKSDIQEEKRVSEWKAWHKNIAENIATAFDESNEPNTRLNLFKWLKMRSESFNSRTYWSTQDVEATFSVEFCALARKSLSAFWRQSDVLLWSERPQDARNVYRHSWVNALIGVIAESEIEGWIDGLNDDEVVLAARLSTMELSGFASYFDDLIENRYTVVQNVLENEMRTQLADVTEYAHLPLLQDISYSNFQAKKAVTSALLEAVESWPTTYGDVGVNHIAHSLSMALSIIIEAGNEEQKSRLLQLCAQRFERNVDAEDASTWLKGVFDLSPRRGTVLLLKYTKNSTTTLDKNRGINLFGSLFGDRTKSSFENLTDDVRAFLLKPLNARVNKIANINDDVDRYKSNNTGARERAQDARNHLLNLLVDTKGAKTHQALILLSNDPNFAHLVDRLKQLAKELAARDSEPKPLSPRIFNSLNDGLIIVPHDRDSIHTVMMQRLRDLRHDILESEFSNKITLQRVSDELEMRNNLGGMLETINRNAYSVTMEAVKKREKRTDIRLTAAGGTPEAAIELKVDQKNRWSANDLEHALRDQLVRRYLSHKRCRSGCLLIVLRESRKWVNPKSKKKMDFEELLAWLSEVAKQEEINSGGVLKISVFGIDLTCNVLSKINKDKL